MMQLAPTQRAAGNGLRRSLTTRGPQPQITCLARPQHHQAPLSSSAAPSNGPSAPQLHQKLAGFALPSAAALTPLMVHVGSALAKDGELGILEGRTSALIHPAIMFAAFGGSLYAAYSGYQWRRTREIGDEIRDLKKQLPAVPADGPRPSSPLDATISSKEKERKELVGGGFRDKHNAMGSLLLASGTVIAIEGAMNTYIRTGKLFPGPHLYAGAGIVALWAMAAGLVPEMQKGNNTARNLHIALNTVNLALFTWQIPTGWEIVEKVFQFTQWP